MSRSATEKDGACPEAISDWELAGGATTLAASALTWLPAPAWPLALALAPEAVADAAAADAVFIRSASACTPPSAVFPAGGGAQGRPIAPWPSAWTALWRQSPRPG
jgi:hypothetical protein